jgi:hypothetical protein
MAKKVSKKSRKAVDVKSAAANDIQVEAPVMVKRLTPEDIIKQSEAPVVPADVQPTAPVAPKNQAIASGAAYHVLAGRPSKPAVVACFGKSGYALSWVARAAKMNVTPEALCEKFKADPAGLKSEWEVASAKPTTKS